MYKLYKYSFIIVGTLPVKTSFEIVNKAGKMIFATQWHKKSTSLIDLAADEWFHFFAFYNPKIF